MHFNVPELHTEKKSSVCAITNCETFKAIALTKLEINTFWRDITKRNDQRHHEYVVIHNEMDTCL